jgi:tetratricopeptide (TPR) repeat protein
VHSGAVALFVAQARRVRPTFALTTANIADVVTVCRSLDGLPLAIELAAARSKLLSPRALLSRLDHALDLSIAAVDRPARQQTLRQTIDWSYQLLSDEKRAVFRVMGIFAGGADLDAVENVVRNVYPSAAIDVLAVVGDLVDDSLLRILETAETEPRVTLLDTVRAYARDILTASGDGDAVARAHAEYYRALAATLYEQSFGADQRRARGRFVTEQENIVAALDWTLAGSRAEDSASYWSRIVLGVGLCADSLTAWARESQLVTAKEWAARAIALSADRDWIEAATCRIRWSNFLCQAGGDLDRAAQYTKTSIDLLTRIDDTDHMPDALKTLGWIHLEQGNLETARAFFDQALSCFAAQERDARANLDSEDWLAAQHNIACTLRLMGRSEEAVQSFRRILPMSLEMNQLYHLIVLCEDYAAALVETGALASAARLIGGADKVRIEHALLRPQAQEAELRPAIAAVKIGLGEEGWVTNLAIGMTTPIDILLSRA